MADNELDLEVTAGEIYGMLDLVGFSVVACGDLGLEIVG